MELKLMLVDNNKIPLSRNSERKDSILNNRIWKEETYYNERFYVYSVIMRVNGDSYGVTSIPTNDDYGAIKEELESGVLPPLDDHLSENQLELIRLRFVVIDTETNQVFYDGDKRDIKTLLFNLFDINYKQINVVVSIDEFIKLKKLKIKTYNKGQISIYDKHLSKMQSELDKLIDPGRLAFTSYEVVAVKEGAFFNRNQFQQLLDKRQSKLIEITASGFDDKGNEVIISSEISKKIKILPDYSSFKEKRDLSLSTLVKAVKEEIDDEENYQNFN